MRLLLALALLTAAVALACAGPEPTATPRPTAAPLPPPTATPIPTATALPTATPPPTATLTPVPTATALPTATPIPTTTPPPTATPVYSLLYNWQETEVITETGGFGRGFTLSPTCYWESKRCRVSKIYHDNGAVKAYLFIPPGYRVDRGDGVWLGNCREDCRLVPLPDIPGWW